MPVVPPNTACQSPGCGNPAVAVKINPKGKKRYVCAICNTRKRFLGSFQKKS